MLTSSCWYDGLVCACFLKHCCTKSCAVGEYWSGNAGGSPWTIAVNCAKTFWYVSGGYG